MEIWKAIECPSMEFDYEVSNMGNVRSLNYNRTGKTQVKTPYDWYSTSVQVESGKGTPC